MLIYSTNVGRRVSSAKVSVPSKIDQGWLEFISRHLVPASKNWVIKHDRITRVKNSRQKEWYFFQTLTKSLDLIQTRAAES
ncbi:hypothetical protein HZ326_23855 [Fusarium oxysporum f. sp. albedinis]|nr:hypothetical protein HZ326_23855 [Fusarium oxysporum f. sp. albedinis]